MSNVLKAGHHPVCYPSNPEKALAFFRDVLAIDRKKSRAVPSGPLLGVVTPHIDFRVSLRAYAHAFGPLLDLPLAETYLILGVGHRSYLPWNLDRRDYLTPLGTAICAQDLVDRLSESAGHLFEPLAHVGEHSIEFALVWLQAIHRLHSPGQETPVRFVPLLCGGLHEYIAGTVPWEKLHDFHHLSRTLGTLLGETKTIRVMVSIDGCHIGPRFDHPFPVTPEFLQETAAWEERLWAQVAKGDARAFLEWMRAEGNGRYFDGVGALALLLAACPGISITRTFYEQWFTKKDASAVTFSSGVIGSPSV